MFLAIVGLLACCIAAGPISSGQTSPSGTIYRSGERTHEIKQRTPDRYDIYDSRGNRLGYGQRSPINGDIDLFDTHGRRLAPVIKPNGGRGRSR